jgi:hypothetical protein
MKSVSHGLATAPIQHRGGGQDHRRDDGRQAKGLREHRASSQKAVQVTAQAVVVKCVVVPYGSGAEENMAPSRA